MIGEVTVERLADDVAWRDINLATHSLTHWAKTGTCVCGGELVMLVGTWDSAEYQCCGRLDTRPAKSAYSPDACYAIVKVFRDGRPARVRGARVRP